MPKVSDEYKRQKREQLLKSAEVCFAEKGFKETTIDDIAKESGTSKGSIYLYFNSKEEIFLQLNELRTADVMENMNLEKFHSAEEKLKAFFSMLSKKPDELDKSRSFIRLQIETWLYLSRQEEYHHILVERFDYLNKVIADIIKEGQRNGEFTSEADAEMIAKLIWMLQDGSALWQGIGVDPAESKKVWHMTERLVFETLKPR